MARRPARRAAAGPPRRWGGAHRSHAQRRWRSSTWDCAHWTSRHGASTRWPLPSSVSWRRGPSRWSIPGFVLSAGATAAIIVLATRVAQRQGSAWRRTATAVVAASLATELVLLPFSASFFDRVTVAGLLLTRGGAVDGGRAGVGLAHRPCASSDACRRERLRPGDGVGCRRPCRQRKGGGVVPWLALRMPAPAAWVSATYLLALAGLVAGASLPALQRHRVKRSGGAVPQSLESAQSRLLPVLDLALALANRWVLAGGRTRRRAGRRHAGRVSQRRPLAGRCRRPARMGGLRHRRARGGAFVVARGRGGWTRWF